MNVEREPCQGLFYRYHPSITELADLETAICFAVVNFTGVGYADAVPGCRWQIRASLEEQ